MQALSHHTDSDLDVLVTELLAALNARDADAASRFWAVEFSSVEETGRRKQRSRESVREELAGLFSAFPDLRVATREVHCRGDRIVVFWIAEGTHLGVFLNIPATGREVAVTGASSIRLGGGEIVSEIHLWDAAALLRQMRLLPTWPQRNRSHDDRETS